MEPKQSGRGISERYNRLVRQSLLPLRPSLSVSAQLRSSNLSQSYLRAISNEIGSSQPSCHSITRRPLSIMPRKPSRPSKARIRSNSRASRRSRRDSGYSSDDTIYEQPKRKASMSSKVRAATSDKIIRQGKGKMSEWQDELEDDARYKKAKAAWRRVDKENPCTCLFGCESLPVYFSAPFLIAVLCSVIPGFVPLVTIASLYCCCSCGGCCGHARTAVELSQAAGLRKVQGKPLDSNNTAGEMTKKGILA